MFKYLEAVPRMGSILGTLRVASIDLALFMVLIVIVYFGFASAFYVCFGDSVADYRTLADATGALSRLILGDYDYPALAAANGVMARLLFYSFVLIVIFVVLSMFLALINDAYSEVKSQEPSDSEVFSKIASLLFNRRTNIKDLTARLQDGDKNNNSRVTLEELREALKGNASALALLDTTTVDELMQKYDIDDDGELSREELVEIISELAEREAEIAGEALCHGAHRRFRLLFIPYLLSFFTYLDLYSSLCPQLSSLLPLPLILMVCVSSSPHLVIA